MSTLKRKRARSGQPKQTETEQSVGCQPPEGEKIVFSYGLYAHQKSPDSGDYQYKSTPPQQRFDPALRAGGGFAGEAYRGMRKRNRALDQSCQQSCEFFLLRGQHLWFLVFRSWLIICGLWVVVHGLCLTFFLSFALWFMVYSL